MQRGRELNRAQDDGLTQHAAFTSVACHLHKMIPLTLVSLQLAGWLCNNSTPSSIVRWLDFIKAPHQRPTTLVKISAQLPGAREMTPAFQSYPAASCYFSGKSPLSEETQAGSNSSILYSLYNLQH